MTSIIIIGILLLLALVLFQYGRVSDLTASLRGEEEVKQQRSDRTATYISLFFVLFLAYVVYTFFYYKDIVLWWGPHTSASEHGHELDSIFNVTMWFTGIVFFITHIALLYFVFKYRSKPGRKAQFFYHSGMLEAVWTIVPSIVLVYLVSGGLIAWNKIMPDKVPDEEYLEIEATGYQFAWDLRYPGADGQLGTRNYRMIDPASNPLGQEWTDLKNHDDFLPSELVLPVNQKVLVRITAKDVLHNFYLPHFRVKIDAVPGIPSYFIFTPTLTTEEYRTNLSSHPDWQKPADPSEPDGPEKWETFEYELACAELCGIGHYSMKRTVRIVTQDEYDAWLAEQSSYYVTNIRNTDADPYKGDLLEFEIRERKKELMSDVNTAMSTPDDDSDDLIQLKHVFFETGSANLRDISRYELDNVVSILKNNPEMKIDLRGHTDNTGTDEINEDLSLRRATSVREYIENKGIDGARLDAHGFGSREPIDTNDTDEGRQNNRRTEMKLFLNKTL